ncbi:hypothetical protein [Streptomyces sp. NPDC101455]|uniref:DUF6197 family protein n=1 Tax=Streptomyces sp. NPDC101455 TaxID=3366142 RepID=UPI0038003985
MTNAFEIADDQLPHMLTMRNAALQLAADFLAQTGWAPRSKGWPSDRSGPLRITQALAEVLGHDDGGTPAGIPGRVSNAALSALLDQIGAPGMITAIWDWEEEPGRTQSEAIAILRSAAEQRPV